MVRKNILRKQKIVEEIVALIKSGKTVAIASVDHVPASLMQRTRKGLAGKAKIKVVKKRLLLRALEQVKKDIPGIEELQNHMSGQTAVIVSDLDPFRLFRMLKEFREHMPVKAGQIAPVDIVIPAGITPVPAPMIAEIKAAGIPSKVTRGFVEVTEDFVAVRAGEVVPPAIASALAKMDIKPVEVGVTINAAWSEGLIFPKDVLDVSVEKVMEDVRTAAMHALNLAVSVAYPTKESLPILIAKAHAEALNLAVNAKILTRETIGYILAEARAHALALASRLPADALDEETKNLIQSTQAVSISTSSSEAKEEKEEEEKEEKSEEEAAAGLASLFG